MREFLGEHWKASLAAVVLHGLFAALLFVAVRFSPQSQPAGQLAIQAVVVDQSQLRRDAQRAQREAEEREKQERERVQNEERNKAAAEEREQQEKTKQDDARKAEKERQTQLAREAEEAEVRRQAEAKRQADTKRQAEAEQQRKLESEQQKKAEAEKQRVAEIQRKQQEEAQQRRAADDAKAQAVRESELKRQLADEEGRTQAVDSGLLAQYKAMIQQRVMRNWNRPLSATAGLECEVRVSQATNGTVLSAQVGRCTGDDAVKQSIEQAVYKASPLPLPPDQRLFERNLVFIFKPQD